MTYWPSARLQFLLVVLASRCVAMFRLVAPQHAEMSAGVVFAIDNAHFMDDETWSFLETVASTTEAVFCVLAMMPPSPLHPLPDTATSTLKVREVRDFATPGKVTPAFRSSYSDSRTTSFRGCLTGGILICLTGYMFLFSCVHHHNTCTPMHNAWKNMWVN